MREQASTGARAQDSAAVYAKASAPLFDADLLEERDLRGEGAGAVSGSTRDTERRRVRSAVCGDGREVLIGDSRKEGVR